MMYVIYLHMGQIHTHEREGRRKRGGELETETEREREKGREGASEWEHIRTNYKANEVKCEQ